MTNKLRRLRAVPIRVAAVLAVALAGAAIAVSTGDAAHQTTARHALRTPKAAAFRADMRKLWEDHITWTRQVIVSFSAGLPDLQTGLNRLLRNQDDIGAAVSRFYGKPAGRQLSALLRQHILIAADVLSAAKENDQRRLADAQASWRANADAIARFLHRADPRFLQLGDMRSMMRKHLALTTDEAVARLTANWSADVKAYDRVHREILQMSDMIANAIIKQFPRRFQ